MTVEIREIWVNDVRYSVEEAHALLRELDDVLLQVATILDPPKPVPPAILVKFAALEADKEDFDKSEPDNGEKHCTTCGEEGHNKQTCTVEDNSREYLCTVCREPGHNRRTCPTRRRVHCSICGEEGHNKATCEKTMDDMVKEAREKLDDDPRSPERRRQDENYERDELIAKSEAQVAHDAKMGGNHQADVVIALHDPHTTNFGGWNAYMKNRANHIRFIRGRRKGHLNLKRMGEEYRKLKYGSSKRRRTGKGRRRRKD